MPGRTGAPLSRPWTVACSNTEQAEAGKPASIALPASRMVRDAHARIPACYAGSQPAVKEGQDQTDGRGGPEGQPPENSITAPVRKRVLTVARKAMTSPISCGSARRPTGTLCRT